MISKVLLFDPPSDLNLDVGADVRTLTKTDGWSELVLESAQRKVLVLNANSKQLQAIVGSPWPENLIEKPLESRARLIVLGDPTPNTDFSSLIRSISRLGTIYSTKAHDIAEAASFQSHQEMEEQLESLAVSENLKLQELSSDLEGVVQKRERNLQRAQKRMLTINRQLESLMRSLQAVHSAKSISEVEKLLLESLQSDLSLSFVRVYFSEHLPTLAQIERQGSIHTASAPLLSGPRTLGHLLFGRLQQPFADADKDFLYQVAEAVSLSIDRLVKIEEAETLKQQWDSTFDSISEPLCLADSQFKILKTNRAFEMASTEPQRLIGQNCFQAFVGKGSEPQILGEGSLMIEKKTSQGEAKVYSVSAQRIKAKTQGADILIVIFRDMTQQKRLERQIFESAKMAELGTVGSSIAHELNNPLGGLLNFLQLIKMDMNTGDPLRPDILAMEQAGLRCKDIIADLLGFTRQQNLNETQILDLREVVQQSLRLIELRARPLGIQILNEIPNSPVNVLGNGNLLTQALSHVLQDALEAIDQRHEHEARFKGEIQVRVLETQKHAEIFVQHNAGEPPQGRQRPPGLSLGLSMAYKIVDEHRGQLIGPPRGQKTPETRLIFEKA
jgi:two-component system, NtrC family, sensor kinase